MRRVLRIGVIYDHPRWEEKHIIKKVKELGHNPIEVPLRSVTLDYAISDADFDIGIQRAVSSARAITSTAYFESKGLKIINSSKTQIICDNKVLTDAELMKAGLPIPRTVLSYDMETAIEAAKRLGYPVVVKPVQGSWGRLQALANDETCMRSILEYRESMPSPQFRVHYIQEYIRKPNRDMRIFVIGDDVPVGIYRISEKDWRTNTALGGRAEPVKITEEIRDLALKAAEAVGGGVLGVDVAEDPERGYVVIEVNSNVDFKNTIRVTGFDVGQAIVEYVIREAKR